MILLLTVFIRVSFKYAVDASFMLFHSRLSFSSAWLYGSVLLLLLLFRCFSPCLFFLPFTLYFFCSFLSLSSFALFGMFVQFGKLKVQKGQDHDQNRVSVRTIRYVMFVFGIFSTFISIYDTWYTDTH